MDVIFCDIHFRLVANCDWFIVTYVVCHIVTIFLPCFLYTVISIVYFVASYIDKKAEDEVI